MPYPTYPSLSTDAEIMNWRLEKIEQKTEELATIDQELSTMMEQVAEQKKIVAEEETKANKQAWKRRAAELISKESKESTDAKKLIGQLQSNMYYLEEKAKALRSMLLEIQRLIDDDKEMEEWSKNLALPRKERRELPYPARIKRMIKREEEERLESQARGEWVSLTLDHRSARGQEARNRFYARMDGESCHMSVATEIIKPESVSITVVEEQAPVPKRKSAWWQPQVVRAMAQQ